MLHLIILNDASASTETLKSRYKYYGTE